MKTAMPNPFMNHPRGQPREVDRAMLETRSVGRIAPVIFQKNAADLTLASILASPSQPGGTAGVPENGEPETFEVKLQAQAALPAQCAVYWQLRYWVHGAAFLCPPRVLNCTNGARDNGMVVNATAVEVTLFGVTTLAAPPLPLPVSVAIGKGMRLGADGYNQQWAVATVLGGAAAVDVLDANANKFTNGGCIQQAHYILKTAGAGPLWLLFFDTNNAGALANGAVPIPGGRLDALSAAGQGTSYGDEFRPGGLNFGSGLGAALSTTPATLTLPGAGPSAVLDCKVGT